MIQRDRGNVVFICDECDDEVFDTNERDFGEACRTAKSLGWTNERVGLSWENRCPDCNSDRRS